MKKLLVLVLALLLPCLAAQAEAVRITPTPTLDLSALVLKESADEVKAYKSPNYNAPIAGYIIVGGRQKVEVLSTRGDWCYISFTSINGTDYGWVPMTRFEAQATVTPTPLPTATPLPQNIAYVNNYGINGSGSGGRLNLRAMPDVTSDSRGKYYTGTPVLLLGRSINGYAEVSVGLDKNNLVQGWMDERYLSESAYAYVNELPRTTTRNPRSGVNLRSRPTDQCAILGWYPHGTAVTVMGVTENGWCHVQVGGQMGFMYADLLQDDYPWDSGTESDDPTGGVLYAGGKVMYVVSQSSTDRLHLRTEARYDAKSLGKFYRGTPVTVLHYTRTGWAYVRVCDLDRLEGYMDMSYLSGTPPTQRSVTKRIDNPYGTGLNLRTAPNSASNVIMLCPNGSTVTLLGDLSDNWCLVNVGGRVGFMMGTRLK